MSAVTSSRSRKLVCVWSFIASRETCSINNIYIASFLINCHLSSGGDNEIQMISITSAAIGRASVDLISMKPSASPSSPSTLKLPQSNSIPPPLFKTRQRSVYTAFSLFERDFDKFLAFLVHLTGNYLSISISYSAGFLESSGFWQH